MRIAILGGYGVFGSRLAELLLRDGHAVWIVGRRLQQARALAARIGGSPMAVDIRTTPEAIFECAPEMVVDAAGPFQFCGNDPYIIPRLCLEHGADYLDLSDDAGFTAGFAVLDRQAREGGRRLLSGASSVPGIASAVAADLCDGFDEILLIDTAILPGNRAPRGASVIAGIVGQLGTASPVWRGGIWRNQPCWSDARPVRLAAGLVRTGRFIEVPDIRLFPHFFGARSVMFRAGMELGVLNAAMCGFAVVRRHWPFEITPRRARLFQWIANLFLPFGTDRGGMRVAVVGRAGETVIRREWRLVAEAGDGPYIPAVAARTLTRRLAKVRPGARACLAEATRAEIEDAMTDLAVSTEIEEAPCPTLFQAALAERWDRLPREVQILHGVHDVESFSGTARVTRGASIMARFAARVFGFPPAAEAVPVTVTMTRTETGEIWERNFGGRVFRSHCTPSDTQYRYRERFGLFEFELDLVVAAGSMRLPVRRGWFLGIPLPGILLPKSDSREYARDGIFHFDVGLGAPLDGGPIVRYQGQLRPDRGSPEPLADFSGD